MATRNPNLSVVRKAVGVEQAPSETEPLLHGERGAWWYTGKQPAECPGFSRKDGKLRSLPAPSLSDFSRDSVLDYFDNCWTLTELLLSALQGSEAFVRQPYHQLRHPMMFYYCHPAVLYVNKFRIAGLLTDGVDSSMEQMFEVGVDEMSWDDLAVASTEWPGVLAVHAYRQKAYLAIRNAIATHPCLDAEEVGEHDIGWAVFMGCEHERIHIETSSVLMRELPLQFVRKPAALPEYHPSQHLPSAAVPVEGVDFPVNDMISVSADTVVLGKPQGYPSFGWDNEYGRREMNVAAFSASKYMVTNGEFLQFVRAGGYHNSAYWSADGWGWKTFRNIKWPTFWIPDGPAGLHRYKLRVLFDAITMRWDWPVDANYHEGRAFCAWKTEGNNSPIAIRLLTEAEHMLLRSPRDRPDSWRFAAVDDAAAAVDAAHNVDITLSCSGENAESRYGFNLQLAHCSSSPVTALPSSKKGFHDTIGNAWEWGEDHFAAFPGFRVHPYYEDFSAPCFSGQHNLIIGGSFMSTGSIGSKYARYQFRPHFFQHAGFRVVAPQVDLALYDATRFGRDKPIVPFAPTSCMDCAGPHVGSGPCCSQQRRAAFTPTLEEEATAQKAKLQATQALYESDILMAQYLSLHFGPTAQVYPSLVGQTGLLQDAMAFPQKNSSLLAKLAKGCGASMRRALDLGCSVGGASFELSRHYKEVVGVDISSRFVEVANRLRESRSMDYQLQMEGEVFQRLTAVVDSEIDTTRVSFVQGDACSLPESLGTFDAVMASNLLCRVADPQKCLRQIHAILNPGGILLLASPFSWLDEYSNRSRWVGGTYEDGVPLRSEEALKDALSEDFDVLSEDEAPLVIREHVRKYQLIITHRLVLRKK